MAEFTLLASFLIVIIGLIFFRNPRFQTEPKELGTGIFRIKKPGYYMVSGERLELQKGDKIIVKEDGGWEFE